MLAYFRIGDSDDSTRNLGGRARYVLVPVPYAPNTPTQYRSSYRENIHGMTAYEYVRILSGLLLSVTLVFS